MRIALGADHNGLRLKDAIKRHLVDRGHDVVDFGTNSEDPIDYPDVAEIVSRAVVAGEAERAILVCGTGLGMAITANKIHGIRAAPVTDPYSAERAMASNHAQVLCLGGKVIGPDVAVLLVDHWLQAAFQGGDSTRKVGKISALDDQR